jgi:uncharacterized membrane protein (DUF2068 family)
VNVVHGTPSAETRAHRAGLRAVASLEATKGIIVLCLGLGLLSLLHKDVEEAAENALYHLHISPDHRLSRALIHVAAKVNDKRLWALAGGAMAYSIVRFVEAYGLWNCRVWAEWFALLSGTMYLPWELYKLLEHPDWMHGGIFGINVLIVLYMVYIRFSDVRRSRAAGIAP